MSGKYILRLDDACPTMDVAKWDRIEKICDKFLIRPIIAVVPNNKDKKLIKNNNLAYLDIGEGLKEELDKAEERELLIKQMHIDIASLKDQLQNRMNMIMTKNGQQLNLTLLLLTLISVLGVAEIIGFSRQKTIIVTVALIPFLIFTVRSFIYYKKSFSH